jgi:hypothetical protein
MRNQLSANHLLSLTSANKESLDNHLYPRQQTLGTCIPCPEEENWAISAEPLVPLVAPSQMLVAPASLKVANLAVGTCSGETVDLVDWLQTCSWVTVDLVD